MPTADFCDWFNPTNVTEDIYMKYISTRGGAASGVSSAYAINCGLAEDGGLFMPEKIPKIYSELLAKLSSLSYAERAVEILSLFLSDFDRDALYEAAMGAYSKERFGDDPAPVTYLSGGISMLELWHGPTCAFKDMALQIMPRLFTASLKKCGEEREALILVATSGDTGKAALEGYRDVDGVSVKVFYPTDGVSQMQKLQMQTQEGDNLSVSGIRGNFDDAQNGVKAIFSDKEFAKRLDQGGVFLSSANSINWGRLVPQIVYYFSAYADMCKCGKICMGDTVDVTVPTGNFGNIFAGFLAKMMGLPIGRLVCASNKNDVLTEFLRYGRYNKNRPFHATISPSMDILISSNLERLIYLLFGQARCKELMGELRERGEYRLTADELSVIQEHFVGYSTDEEECALCIKETFEKEKYLIDTHTSVALSAAKRYMHDYKASSEMLVISTATPYKFAADVLKSAFGISADSTSAPKMIEKLSGVSMPEPIAALGEKKVIHKGVIERDDMAEKTLEFALRKG